MYISIIIPLYKCAPFIEELSERLIKTLIRINHDFEIIFVNDASPIDDWEIVNQIAKKDSRIKGINLSRNFGQHYAITAGLTYATGDWIVVMDGDLQDKPEEIEKLYNKTREGYKIIMAQRYFRKDHFLKKLSSKMFYAVFGYLTGTKLDYTVANYGIYHKKAIHAFLQMKDETRYFPTMIQWVGFIKTYVPVEHDTRKEGRSSYSFKQLIKLAKSNIIAFSDKPLHITIRFGFFIAFSSFLIGIYHLIQYFVGNITQLGFTSLILSIWFLSGIIITILGMLGIYLGKMFDKVKDRPLFIVMDHLNINIED